MTRPQAWNTGIEERSVCRADPVLVCRDRSGCWHTCGCQGLSHTKCNAYDSRLKNWMHHFHGVASRYLSSHLGWRRILDETKDALTPTDILRAALGVPMDQQLTRT